MKIRTLREYNDLAAKINSMDRRRQAEEISALLDTVVVMTHPSGNPAEVRMCKVELRQAKGFKIGYSEPEIPAPVKKAPARRKKAVSKEEFFKEAGGAPAGALGDKEE